MAAIRPIRCRLLLATEDGRPVEIGYIEVPITIHRDGTLTLHTRKYRRRLRSLFRAIIRTLR